MKIHTAYISLGSNLGSKLENCRRGINALSRSGTCRLIEQSRIYQTEPVDYTNQDWFVNCAVKIETELSPLSLLEFIKAIERDAGRIQDEVRFGPRILDMDIIFYDDLVMNDPRLVIPHPRMHKRRFVLKPICDIDPHINHPVLKRNMHFLLDNLEEKGQGLIEYQ